MKAACDNYDNIAADVKQKLADGSLTVADIDALYDAAKEIDRLYVDRDSIDAVFASLLDKAQTAYDNAVPSLQAVIVNGEQITSNSVQSDQFTPANLIRPESDGYGTGQYIFHTSWSDPLPADEYPYLQVHMNAPQSSFRFSMISSEWDFTYDTPEDMEILATNTPDDENSWASVRELKGIVSGSGLADAHPVRYTSPMIELGAEYSDVRFLVKKTINMRATNTGGFYLSLGRFQMYTGIDPERVQYNYNPDAGASIRFGQYAGEDEAPAYLENPYAMWRFVPIEGTDGYSLQNLATSHSIAPTSGRGEANVCRMQGGFSPFRVDYIGKGQMQFVSLNENNAEEYPLHAQDRGSVIVPWATDVDGASCWGVIPVEDDAYLNFPIEANSIRVMTLPFDISAGANSLMSMNSNAFTYSVKNITVDASAGKTSVELTLCEEVKAGVPFVIIEGDYNEYDAENVETTSIYTTLPAAVDTTVREANGLAGTFDGCDISKEGYGYMRGGKLNVTTGTPVHIYGMSGWLDLDKVSPQEGATDVVITVDGIINDIREIDAAAAKACVNVYTR